MVIGGLSDDAGFDSLRILKTERTAATAATAPTIIPIISISSERLNGAGDGAGDCGSLEHAVVGGKDSVGKGAEHFAVSDWKGFSLLQQLRWL